MRQEKMLDRPPCLLFSKLPFVLMLWALSTPTWPRTNGNLMLWTSLQVIRHLLSPGVLVALLPGFLVWEVVVHTAQARVLLAMYPWTWDYLIQTNFFSSYVLFKFPEIKVQMVMGLNHSFVPKEFEIILSYYDALFKLVLLTIYARCASCISMSKCVMISKVIVTCYLFVI